MKMAELLPPKWLNNELIQRALRESEKDDSICVINLIVKPATSKGDNYTSDIFRVTVNFQRKQQQMKTKEKRSIIVKVAHTTEGLHKELVDRVGVVDIEIKMMSTTLVEMERLLGDTKLCGKYIYGQEDPPIMIIEDLSALGFKMANREVGLDLQHTLIALRGLAKFHASSVAVCEKDPKQKELYNKGIFFENDEISQIKQFFIGAIQALAKSIETWSEVDKTYGKKLMKMSDRIYQIFIDRMALDEKEFNVINHGDFWVNNMMFSYGENGEVKDQIFVDFQVSVYKSPALDLNYFIHASLAEEVFINHRNEIINEYLDVLTKTMRKIGCKTSPPTLIELNNMIRKYEIYGLFSACVCLPIMTVNKKDVKSIEELMSNGTYENKGLDNPFYQKRMVRRLSIWNDMGLLDL